MKNLFSRPDSLRTQVSLSLAVATLLGALAGALGTLVMYAAAAATGSAMQVVFALFLLLGALWLTRHIVQSVLTPLKELAQTLANLDTTVPLHSPLKRQRLTELDTLAQAFNKLSQSWSTAQANFEAAVATRTLALAQNETRLNHVLNASAEGFWDWNLTNDIVTVNPRCCQLLGLDPRVLQMLSQTLFDRLPPSQRASERQAMNICLRSDTPCERELQLSVAGSTVWVLLHSSVVERNTAGRAVRVVGSISNITPRKIAEQALKASEERLQLATQGNTDGIWDWYPDSGKVFFSERWKTMLGYSADEIGDHVNEWVERVHPDDLDWVMREVQQHLDGQTPLYQTEHRMRHKDGHYLWILDRGRAQRDAHGKAIRMTGSHTDVTERRVAQNTLQEQTQLLNTILDLSPDGFVAFDANNQVCYVNPAFSTLTAIDPAPLFEMDKTHFWHSLCTLCMANVSAQELEIGKPTANHTPGRFLVDISLPVRRVLHIAQRDTQGNQPRTIVSLRDVTHETEVERLKSEFLSTAAHELRTPLASIYGFAEVLLKQYPNDGTRKEFLEIIYRQSHVMSLLINELLDLSRIEARRGKDFDLRKTAAQTLLQELIGSFNLPPGRHAPLLHAPANALLMQADSAKARQAILNVLSNAYKYSPEGGDIQIVLKHASAADGSPCVAICIIDQGIGMTEPQKNRMFDRFYRADRSSKIAGTGLGMSIAKEIMALHGGSISVDSTLGAGTCVCLLFPAPSQTMED